MREAVSGGRWRWGGERSRTLMMEDRLLDACEVGEVKEGCGCAAQGNCFLCCIAKLQRCR